MQYKKPETKNQKSNASGRGNTSTIENQKSSFNAKSPKLLEKLQNDKKLLNPPKKSKKKTLILLIILCVIVGGFFCWWKSDEIGQAINRRLDIMQSRYSPPEQYSIKDLPEGKLIQNKKQGFSAIIEPEWTAEIEQDGGWTIGSVSCLSPDYEWNYKNHGLVSGCGIRIKIMKTNKSEFSDAGRINAKILEIKRNEFIPDNSNIEIIANDNFREYKVVEVNSRESLKEIMSYGEIMISKFGISQEINISIPVQNKVYLINSMFANTNQDRCEKALNQFLKTVSIK